MDIWQPLWYSALLAAIDDQQNIEIIGFVKREDKNGWLTIQGLKWQARMCFVEGQPSRNASIACSTNLQSMIIVGSHLEFIM